MQRRANARESKKGLDAITKKTKDDFKAFARLVGPYGFSKRCTTLLQVSQEGAFRPYALLKTN